MEALILTGTKMAPDAYKNGDRKAVFFLFALVNREPHCCS